MLRALTWYCKTVQNDMSWKPILYQYRIGHPTQFLLTWEGVLICTFHIEYVGFWVLTHQYFAKLRNSYCSLQINCSTNSTPQRQQEHEFKWFSKLLTSTVTATTSCTARVFFFFFFGIVLFSIWLAARLLEHSPINLDLP